MNQLPVYHASGVIFLHLQYSLNTIPVCWISFYEWWYPYPSLVTSTLGLLWLTRKVGGEYSSSHGGFASYGMWCCVIRQAGPVILKDYNAFIFGTERSKKIYVSWTSWDKIQYYSQRMDCLEQDSIVTVHKKFYH